MAGFFRNLLGKIFGKPSKQTGQTELHIEDYIQQTEDLYEDIIQNVTPVEEANDYIPTVYYVNIIRAYIDSLPDERTFYDSKSGMYPVDISAKKNILFEIIDDSINEVGEEEYEKYLSVHQEEISTYCSIITYASDQQTVETALTNLATALNMTPLSHSQAERVSIYTETMYGW